MINNKKIISGLILTAILITTPTAIFADENNDNKEKNRDKKSRVEISDDVKIKGNSKFSSIFNINREDDKDDKESNKYKSEINYKNNSWFNSSWFNGRDSKITNTPVISNFVAVSNKSKNISLKWDTNARSNSYVWYSTVPQIDTSTKPTIKRNNKVSKHKIVLNKLEANTTYYIVVGSSNKLGITKSAEISFTTPEAKIYSNVPVITSVTGPTTLVLGEIETVTINAKDLNGKTLSYSANWGDGIIVANTSFTDKVTLNHTYSKAGIYDAKFIVTNSDGKKASYTMKITVTPVVIVDTTAPVISDIVTTVNGSNSTISWKTNENATSNIFYSTLAGLNINLATTPKVSDQALVTTHSISIPSLTSNTLYHFILKSVDASNNVVVSSESAFTTN